VLAAGTDSFLERVRVTVEGTSLETFTDAAGAYRIESVPVGTARVKLFYTGMTPLTTAVTVVPAQTIQHDVTMTAAGQTDAKSGPVKLEQFVVTTSKEMEASAIAINEQRFASNLKTVVSTDEFGTVAEGHVGEFLKFLPGVTMDTPAATPARSPSTARPPTTSPSRSMASASPPRSAAFPAPPPSTWSPSMASRASKFPSHRPPTPPARPSPAR
jgi:hypothetical protein